MSRHPLVLVVDDMYATRHLMRRVLERDGMTIIEAASGEEALRQIGSRLPDLVILDLRLPGMSGLEVARAVRQHADRRIATTPLLACSASVQPDIQAGAIAAGCDAFEGKPFDVTAFARRVRDLIEARGAA